MRMLLALFEQVVAYMRLGKLEESLAGYDRVLELDGERVETVQAAILGDEVLADYWRNNNDSFANLSRLIDKPTEIHVAIVSSPTPKPSTTPKPSQIPIPSPTLTPMPEGLLFYEDFEVSPLSTQAHQIDVKVVYGNNVYRLTGRPTYFGSMNWKDYAVEFDLMVTELSQEGQLSTFQFFIRQNHVNINNPIENYQVEWHLNFMNNLISIKYRGKNWKQVTLGKVVGFQPAPDVWYHFRVEAAGNNISLYVDDNLNISNYDPQARLDSGFAGIHFARFGEVIIDNIRVEEIP